MKRFIKYCAIVVLICAAPVHSQITPSPSILAVAPPGSCSGDVPLWSHGGSLYICSGGTPTALGGGGSGTVTVVGSGTLTSTALVTGGGSQAVQTPSATATMDTSGNIATPGSVTATGGLVSGTASSGAKAALPTGAHGLACDESSTAGVPASAVDYLRCDSGTHSILASFNNGAEVAVLYAGSALGTPASGTLTNATGLPISTGVSGLGTSVATALAANVNTTNGFPQLSSGLLSASVLPAANRIEPCGVGINGLGTAISAGTYHVNARCANVFGVTYTITGVECQADNSGSSTANVADSAANALLTGAITMGTANTFASGTQSATTTIASGVWTNWTFVADGTSTMIQCVMTTTR